jgi:hypothetical protein
MVLANKEDEAKRFDQFALMLHANPMTDEKARSRYVKMIEPMEARQAKVGEMKTDFDQLRRMKAEMAVEMVN